MNFQKIENNPKEIEIPRLFEILKSFGQTENDNFKPLHYYVSSFACSQKKVIYLLPVIGIFIIYVSYQTTMKNTMRCLISSTALAVFLLSVCPKQTGAFSVVPSTQAKFKHLSSFNTIKLDRQCHRVSQPRKNASRKSSISLSMMSPAEFDLTHLSSTSIHIANTAAAFLPEPNTFSRMVSVFHMVYNWTVGTTTVGILNKLFVAQPSQLAVEDTVESDSATEDSIFENIETPMIKEIDIGFSKSEEELNISIPYNAAAQMAYESSDRSMPFYAVKVKCKADAIALVKSKRPIDISVPYNAAARMAYESSDRSMSYVAFKTKYEADAILGWQKPDVHFKIELSEYKRM